MAEQNTPALPDGTDTVIEGAANSGAIATDRAGGDDEGGTLTIEDTALVTEREAPAPRGDAERPVSGSGSPETGLADRFRSGREKISSQAGEKARGLVTQGMERTAEALANVSKMVGDTASGIEERLGPEYGDYARRAAGAIENVALALIDNSSDREVATDETACPPASRARRRKTSMCRASSCNCVARNIATST